MMHPNLLITSDCMGWMWEGASWMTGLLSS